MAKYHYLLVLVAVIAEASAASPVPVCDKPNEHYDCGSACQNRCQTLGDPCLIQNIMCNRACYCDKGFARNSTDDCIPARECPPKMVCEQPNEYVDCGSPCQRTCENLDEPCNIFNKKCTTTCYCNYGFARDSNNVCIPEDQCPKTTA